MKVCELDRNWNVADLSHGKPGYSLLELDIFAHTRGKEIPDFRLSVRKNLKTGDFELYRQYHFSNVGRPYPSQTTEEVRFTGSFVKVIEEANRQWSHYWNDGVPIVIDEVCTHDKSKGLAHGCPLSYPHANQTEELGPDESDGRCGDCGVVLTPDNMWSIYTCQKCAENLGLTPKKLFHIDPEEREFYEDR